MKVPRWPWETKRLAEHHWVTRPWLPHRDPRVQLAVWMFLTSVVVAVAWQLQADAGLVAKKTVATLVTALMLWTWRGLHGRLKP